MRAKKRMPITGRRPMPEALESRILLSTFYVATSGSDGNPGTLEAPFATIARGMEAAMPGDSVLLRGGTYRETLSSVRSGLPGQPITVASYNNEAIYISASDAVSGPWTETSPGSGIYSSPVSSSLPSPFWTYFGSATGTRIGEQGGNLLATVVNDNTYSTTAARSINPSSAWNFFAQPVTWRIRDMSISSTGSIPMPPASAYVYFTIMSSTSGGWGSDDSINVQFSSNGNLRLLAKKNQVNSWGTTLGTVTNTAITGFDLTLGPGGAGNIAYTLIAQPTGQVVASGQWALTPAEWSDGGDGSKSYVQVFAQEGVTPATDLNQKFELKVGSYEITNSTATVFRDNFADGELATADYFPSGRTIGRSSGYDQIFVDGQMQVEARYPNKLTVDLLNPDAASLTMNNAYALTGTAFSGKPTSFFAGARFLGRVGEGWSWQAATVTGSSGSTLQLDPASVSTWWWPNFANKTSETGIGYVYGKLEFLDADGEWHLQQSASGADTLYLRMAGGADPTSHVVERKVRNWTVNIVGHDNIILRGLNLRGGAVRLNGSGLVLEDADARYLSHYLTFTQGSAVDGGLAQGGGVVVSGSGNTVRRSTIYDTAGSGVVASGTDHLLTRNHIFNVDYSGTYGTGMNLSGSGHSVTFNTIHDAGRDILRPNGAGMSVMYNDLSRAGRMALDLGLIYTWGSNGQDASGRKTRIAYNWVHERGNPGDLLSTGIYLDNFDRSFIVDHNVIWGFTGSTFSPAAIRLNSPMLNVGIYHNTIIGAPSYNVSTYSSYPGSSPDPFWTIANHGMDYIAQNNLILPSTTDPATVFENYAGRDFRPKAGNPAINPATMTGLVDWTTPNGTTNVPSTFRLYLQTPNQSFHYREVTGQGVTLPGINDGFVGTTADSGAYEAGATYWTTGINGTTDATPPTVAAVSINDGAAQRSMVKKLSISFSEPVTLAPDALTITLSSGAPVPGVTITTTNPSGDQKSYLLTFSSGSLPDGIYDLLVTATGVQDLAGNVLTGNFSHRFHRLFGDADGNRIVNAIDYARLRTTFARSSGDPLFNIAFDYDNNGLINALDLAQFRRRFGMVYSY